MKNVFVAYVLSLALLFSLISPTSVLAQEPVTGDNIFEKILAPQAHPRLLADNDDIAQSKSNISADEYKSNVLNELKSKCDWYITQEPTKFSVSDGKAFNSCILARNRLIDLGTVYLLTGEEKYAQRTWVELEAVCSGSWYDNSWNLDSHRLDSGKLFTGVAFAYDAIYEYLSNDQKAFLTQKVERYIDNCLACSFADPNKYQNSNWAAVEGTAMLLTALSFAGENDDLDLKLKSLLTKSYNLLNNIASKIPADGYWGEGAGYHEYVLEHLAWSIKSLINSCGTDFGLLTYLGIGKMPQYAMRTNTKNGAFNFSTTTGHNTDTLLQKQFCPETMLIADLYNDTNARDLYNNFYKSIIIDGKYGARYLLFAPRDNEFAVATPSFDSFCEQSGFSSIIGSWSDDNGINLAVNGGETGDYNNSHYDKGSFILEALGERWFIDLGRRLSGDGNSELAVASSHNVLTVKSDGDTKGQEKGEGAYPQIYASSKSEAYVVYDLTDVYKNRLNSYNRGFYVGDDRSSLTIRDEIVLSQEKEIQWNFITKADIELSNDKASAVLKLNGKKMYVTANCSLEGWYLKSEPLDLGVDGLEEYTAGINVLSLCASGSGDVSMSVKITPDVDKCFGYPDLLATIHSWTLTQSAVPYVSEFEFKHGDIAQYNKFFVEAENYTENDTDIQFVIAYYNDNELKHTVVFPKKRVDPLTRMSYTEDIGHFSDCNIIKVFAFDDIGSIKPLNKSSNIVLIKDL